MRFLLIGLLLTGPAPISFLDEPPSPGEKYAALLREWQAFAADLKDTAARLPDDEARKRYFEESSGREHAFYARALDLATDHPADPAALDALVWVMYRGLFPEREQALERIISHHAASPKLKSALGYITLRRHHLQADATVYERLLRAVIARNPDRESRGLATLRLAQLLRLRADALRRLDQFPDHYTRLYAENGLDPNGLARLRERTPADLTREAERLCEQAVGDYGDIRDRLHPGPSEFVLGTVGESAGKELREIRDLAIGQTAPEIEGQDSAGLPLKLSDYRGKVVALVFWGSWCGPCMAEVPHERKLVNRLEGRPFVLLGVNGGDRDRATVERVMRAEGITWRSWYDGPTQDGPIASRWNVYAWPTIYVLDPQGVIRYKDVRGEPLAEAVDTLLKQNQP